MRRTFLALAALFAVLALQPWSAAAQPAIPAVAPYFALGDSIADAEGATSHERGYVALFATEAWSILKFPGSPADRGEFGLRGGETSSSMLAPGGQLERATAEIRARNGDSDPANDVRLITVDIGGNDFRSLTRSTSPCLTSVTSTECQDAVNQVIATFKANYPIILQRIRGAAGPDTTIIAMAFYNPFSGTGQAVDAPGDIVVELMTAEAKAVATAAPVNAIWVDLSMVFKGKAPALTHIAEDPPNIHPTDEGHAAIAAAIAKALRDATGPTPPETGETIASPAGRPDLFGLALLLMAAGFGVLAATRRTRA